MSALRSGARSEIDDIVRAANGFFVVFDHDDSVAEIAQFLQRGQQPRVVFVVQADGRLIENIEHAAKARSDLRRKPNALAFAARKRIGSAIQAQVVQSDSVKELQPIPNLPNDPARDQLFSRAQFQIREETSIVSVIGPRDNFRDRLSRRHAPPGSPASGALHCRPRRAA